MGGLRARRALPRDGPRPRRRRRNRAARCGCFTATARPAARSTRKRRSRPSPRSSAVFNNLIRFNQHEKQNRPEFIEPELAESWKWNDDYTRLTFKLRDGVKWHDGKPFTAADVKCTFDLLLGKSQDKLRLNPRKAWYRNLDDVVTEGNDTVDFVLKRPQPAFTMLLASAYGADLSVPCAGRRDAQQADRHGTVQICRIQAQRVYQIRQEHRITGKRDCPISTRSNGRSSRTARRRPSPLSPASSI